MSTNKSPHVWRLAQLTDLRESGDMVLARRGDEPLWVDAPLAKALGMVASRMDEQAAPEPSHALRWLVIASIALLIIGFVLL